MLKLNDSPVRTSRNFRINNIKIDDVVLPEWRTAFDGGSFSSSFCSEKNIEPIADLKYGLGDIACDNVREFYNYSTKITIDRADDIRFSFDFDDNNLSLIDYIEAEAKADCNISIVYDSKSDLKCFHNGIFKLRAEPGVKVNVSIVNLLNDSSINLHAIENCIDDDSVVNYTIIDIGAKYSVSNYYSNMFGTNGINSLKTVYLGTKNQVKDINYIAELYGEKTDINIDVQGALKNGSKKNFKGTIDFKKGCKKAVGNENEYCMLLSKDSKSIALPMLLCQEDDVEGNHSSASGKVDDKELFYIMSRGVQYNDAVKIIVKARFNEIVEGIKNGDLKNQILDVIDERLGDDHE